MCGILKNVLMFTSASRTLVCITFFRQSVTVQTYGQACTGLCPGFKVWGAKIHLLRSKIFVFVLFLINTI